MFSKSVALSLLFLALSSLTVQAAPPLDLAKRQAACSAPVTRTVTVSPTATAAPPPANGGGDNNGGNNGGNGNNNNNGGGNAGNGGNNNNGGNNGGNGGGNNGNNDPQTSLTLDPSVIAANFAQDGQAVPVAGQVSSKTSTNNFINFCLTVPDLPITDGKQVQGGSCNPAPIGQIPSVENMPSAKFQFPLNFATIPSTQQFTIQLRVEGFQVGNFVNAQTNYFAAPQQLNGNGQIIGHTHVVIEKLESLAQTTALDPRKFTFFKGVNGAAVNGVVTADVAAGVPVGDYRLCTIQTSANHAPIIGPVAQHGSFDDCIYFTAAAGAGAGAGNGGNNGGNNGGGNNLVSILPVPTATGAAPGNTASASATSPAASAGAPGATASAGNTAVQPTGAQPTGGAQQPTGAKPTGAAPTGTGAAPPAAEPTNAAPTGTGAAPPAAEPTKANPPAESPATSAAATVTPPAPGATQTCAAPVSVTVTVTETATATAGAPSAGTPTQSPAATAAPAVPPPAAAPPAAAPGKGNNWGKNKNNKFKNGFKNGFRRW